MHRLVFALLVSMLLSWGLQVVVCAEDPEYLAYALQYARRPDWMPSDINELRELAREIVDCDIGIDYFGLLIDTNASMYVFYYEDTPLGRFPVGNRFSYVIVLDPGTLKKVSILAVSEAVLKPFGTSFLDIDIPLPFDSGKIYLFDLDEEKYSEGYLMGIVYKVYNSTHLLNLTDYDMKYMAWYKAGGVGSFLSYEEAGSLVYCPVREYTGPKTVTVTQFVPITLTNTVTETETHTETHRETVTEIRVERETVTSTTTLFFTDTLTLTTTTTQTRIITRTEPTTYTTTLTVTEPATTALMTQPVNTGLSIAIGAITGLVVGLILKTWKK